MLNWLRSILVPAFAVSAAVYSAPIRNVILCIGDGMGSEAVKAARCFAGTNLVFEEFPYQSQMTTGSADSAVTDSAAAATAMATGVKVDNGVLSLAIPGDGSELQTLMEYFQAADKSAGLVTTTYITHATPAAFGAHDPSRGNFSHIADDYLTQTRPNVLFGGGGNGMSVSAAVSAGYCVVTNRASLLALNTSSQTHVSGQFGLTDLPYDVDGLGDLPRLPEMVVAALDILDNDPDGFFLMVEGGRIDHAGHVNDLSRNIGETLAFSEAVQEVLQWAGGREDTLLLVTADHETGGLTVLADNGPGQLPTVTWSTTEHTDVPVTVYGWGLNGDLVAGVVDNTDIHSVAVSSARVPERALSIQISELDGVKIVWTAASNDVYRVEYATTLVPSSWTPLNTVTATSSRLVVQDISPRSGTSFYRLVSQNAGPP